MVNHPNRGVSQKPSVGRIVIFRQSDHDRGQSPSRDEHYKLDFPADAHHAGTNGTREHPAIITQVWGDHCVNLHVFFSGHLSEPRNSVMELPELPEGTVDTSGNGGWFWPPRA